MYIDFNCYHNDYGYICVVLDCYEKEINNKKHFVHNTIYVHGVDRKDIVFEFNFHQLLELNNFIHVIFYHDLKTKYEEVKNEKNDFHVS